MTSYIRRGSVSLFWIVALIVGLGYAANDSPWQLLLVLAMGVMSAVIMAMFKTRGVPITVPITIPVHHD
jgi:membrane-bound metal-dependent hydrolase YbcI (DUF457 family)